VVISVSDLSKSACVPCHGGEVAATQTEIDALLPQIPGWCQFQVNGVDRIERVYLFKDFVTALAFTNAVGEIAETAAHHPVLMTEWGRVTVTWWTHTVQGLHQNDLIMAAKTDDLALSFV
jgi:4a-hydroxytetrahydrobiopterin dehydratase